MRWDQIDFAGKSVFIRSARKGGLDSRRIHMHPELERHLVEWYGQDRSMDAMPGYVVHYHGTHIKKVDKAWTAAKKRAKVLRRLRTYDIRHASISAMLESGADLKAVSLAAGHSSTVMTTKKYQHVSTRLKEVAICSLGSVGEHQEKE